MDQEDTQNWTSQEDDRLREALILNKKGTKNWREVASHVGTKTPHQCQQRWKSTLNPDVLRVKGRWTAEVCIKQSNLLQFAHTVAVNGAADDSRRSAEPRKYICHGQPFWETPHRLIFHPVPRMSSRDNMFILSSRYDLPKLCHAG